MAANNKSLLSAGTLYCFLLLPLAAQAKDTTIVVIGGQARCKSDPSRIISDTTLKLVIDKDEIPGGTVMTTSTGQVAMAVKLRSQEEVTSVTKGKAYLVAPPHACGAPSIPQGTVMAARVIVTAEQTIISPATNISDAARPRINGDTSSELKPTIKLYISTLECLVCHTI
ncbi:hypothetical protein HU200_060650 [Digitaria exilis]|uniref:Uncharacterized protein n=1 Tax=Digitaria exilis TaxID=1010633 RepID=A0A835E1I9_9POAL|nr:hypothetical protein HU200_060650 [Digitaria exilis]CAB3455312.1 unnamed protein product [Digitaria exilis]CAB3461844.1 unnamed protein product [Digitaria exilis]